MVANPDNLENSKKAGREAQGIPGFSKNCTSRESVSKVSIIDPPSGGSMRGA